MNSAEVMIGIWWKGDSMSRSLSPVTIQAAWPSTARFKNLLSLTSLQSVKLLDVFISFPSFSTLLINASLFFSKTYLSNFVRINTIFNSVSVSLENIRLPWLVALSNARRLTDDGNKTALINELVSKTNLFFT